MSGFCYNRVIMSREKITKKLVLDFLKENPIMSIAINGKPVPVSSVILYHAYKDFSFVFTTHRDSFKAKALRKEGKLSYSVWNDNFLVQGAGSAEELKDEKSTQKAIEDILNTSGELENFLPPFVWLWKEKEYTVFRIKADWLRVLDLRNPTIKSKNSKFQEFKF